MWDRLLAPPISVLPEVCRRRLAQRVSTIDAMRQLLSATMQAVMTSMFSVFLLLQMFYYSWELALLGMALVMLSMLATMPPATSLSRHRDVMRSKAGSSALVQRADRRLRSSA